jgi:hypothetical protein
MSRASLTTICLLFQKHMRKFDAEHDDKDYRVDCRMMRWREGF